MNTALFVCTWAESSPSPPLADFLPADRLAALERMAPARREQSARAEILLRQALAERFGLPPREISIIRTDTGRPVCPLCAVSLSHTGGAAAALLSDANCGVDIERLRPPRLRAGQRCFTPEEYAWVLEDVQTRFWEMWTKKEALGKALGIPLLRLGDLESTRYAEGLHTFQLPGLVLSAYAPERPELILKAL
jgi:phosphopantetheinyl transferase